MLRLSFESNAGGWEREWRARFPRALHETLVSDQQAPNAFDANAMMNLVSAKEPAVSKQATLADAPLLLQESTLHVCASMPYSVTLMLERGVNEAPWNL